MRRLILVRHATAVDEGPKGSDFHRRLKKRGRREAQLMAERVASLIGVPDQLFSSPADRALETAKLFAERLDVPAERVTVREELYGGLEPDEFLHIVQRFDNRVKNVIVFGHDPSFTEFAAYMIPDFRQPIPKAGVLVMDIDRSRWQSVRAGDARMVHFERPPAPDEQKRMHEDLMDRLVAAIRAGILSGVREFGLGSSRDVTHAIVRSSTRLARDLSEFARIQDTKDQPNGRKSRGPRRKGATVVAKRKKSKRGGIHVKFAAIDIGSNAVRLLLARVIEEGDEPLLKKEVLVRMPLRLGDDVFREGRISADKAQRLADTMVGFRHLIRAYPAQDFAAYATSAMREASNGEAVVERVRKVSGVSIDIIDGAREAEVIYANHVEHRLDPRRHYLYMDVGGGSTEVSLIVRGRMESTESFPVGGVRALQGKVDPKVTAQLRLWVEAQHKKYGSMVAIGSGGNINTIYKISRVKQGKPISIESMRTIRNMLRQYSLEERIVTLNLRPDRADVIVFAADLYLSVMKWGGIRKMVVPEVGLADGLVHLLYNRHRRTRAKSA